MSVTIERLAAAARASALHELEQMRVEIMHQARVACEKRGLHAPEDRQQLIRWLGCRLARNECGSGSPREQAELAADQLAARLEGIRADEIVRRLVLQP